MIKKIVIGTLLAAMIGLLVYGAWYRTKAKSASESASAAGEHRGQVGAVQGQAAGNWSGLQSADDGQQSPGSGQWSAIGGQQPAIESPLAEVTQLVALAGSVESAAADVVVIAIADQAPVELSGRSLSFALEQGFAFQPGDKLKLTGFYEDQDFEVQAIENLTTGQSVALREENGRPLWAGGGGRRGG
jgi:hypothetical protein